MLSTSASLAIDGLPAGFEVTLSFLGSKKWHSVTATNMNKPKSVYILTKRESDGNDLYIRIIGAYETKEGGMNAGNLIAAEHKYRPESPLAAPEGKFKYR